MKLLLVEDDLTFSKMLGTWLGKKGYDVLATSNVGAAIKALLRDETVPDLVLSDLRLPDHDGLYLLQWLREQGRNTPFIVMTSYAEVQNAVEAMKMGATDYISKPVQPDILLQKIEESVKPTGHPLPEKTGTPPANVSGNKNGAVGIEGSSAVARELYRLATLVAPTPMSVLIVGASGTGKEYVAHRIHEQSLRASGPFVAIDCGALTKDLAASELFGHVKGAFTGAVTDKTGAFEQASGGTLFLDEVGNLSYEVQVQLLRALQERRIRPVGSTEERAADIRLVCATNENLPEAVARGTFREDLFHRINEFTLHMPLLRDRNNDILEFARYFLQQANAELNRNVVGFTPEAERALLTYTWPGNLREMRNVIVRATLLAEGKRLVDVSELNLTAVSVSDTTAALELKPTGEEEMARIQEALRQTGGNKSKAAQLLGIDRKTLYNKLKR